jgi:hypothetical protein
VRQRITFLVPLLLAGCGASGGFQQEFVDACTSSSNLDRPVCRCMAEKAEADLSDDERAFLLAVLRKDEARVGELQNRLGVAGAMRAGTFMTEIASCAVEGQES